MAGGHILMAGKSDPLQDSCMKPEGIQKIWTLSRIWLDSTEKHINSWGPGQEEKVLDANQFRNIVGTVAALIGLRHQIKKKSQDHILYPLKWELLGSNT